MKAHACVAARDPELEFAQRATFFNDHIALLEDQAHTQYHLAVSDGVLGSHDRAASRAVEVIERAGCIAGGD